MADDDEAARKARAESLRQQIARLKPGQTKRDEVSADDSETGSSGSDQDRQVVHEEASSGESPREFVHRKMRELDNKK